MAKNQSSIRPAHRLMATTATVLGLSMSAVRAQPVAGAPLPPGFAPTGRMDGTDCQSNNACNVASQTFAAPNGQELTRLSVKTGRDWYVCEAVDGTAYAYPLKSPADRQPIAPDTMEQIRRTTDEADPAVPADPALQSIGRALIQYNRCKPATPTIPIS